MHMHFYTDQTRVLFWNQSGYLMVWTKECKDEFDLHVSFDITKYKVTPHSEFQGHYMVKLK